MSVLGREFPRLNLPTVFEFIDGNLTSPFIQLSSTGSLRLHVFGKTTCLDLLVQRLNFFIEGDDIRTVFEFKLLLGRFYLEDGFDLQIMQS